MNFSSCPNFTHEDFYESVIANTPLHKAEDLIVKIEKNPSVKNKKIFISVGGIQEYKDAGHRKGLNELKLKYPSFFDEINYFEAEYASHNAVPIVANPYFLTKLFSNFKARYFEIAEVYENYKMKYEARSIQEELNAIITASRLGENFFPPEIPEFNGIASRYLASNYTAHGISIYELALTYFPKYWGFHLSLYELLMEENPIKAKLDLPIIGNFEIKQSGS